MPTQEDARGALANDAAGNKLFFNFPGKVMHLFDNESTDSLVFG